MSRTSAETPRARRGFTLLEILIATSISAIVFAGILAAYLFMGRNLTRLVHTQQQEVQSRRALRFFTQDLSAATEIGVPAAGVLTVTKPTAAGTTTVTYTYSAASGTVVRNEVGPQTILSNLTAYSYAFYSESGSPVAATALQSAKSVELVFTSSLGVSGNGTLAGFTTVSPRVVLRNKPSLQ